MSYLLYDPLDGDHQEFETLEEAQKEAKDLIASILDCCDGWPEEMSSDGVKILKVVEQSQECDRVSKADISDEEWEEMGGSPEWDHMCNYKMEAVQ